MAPKRKATNEPRNVQTKEPAANDRFYIIKCRRKLSLNADDVEDQIVDRRDTYCEMRYAIWKEIEETAQQGKKLGAWSATSKDGDVQVFKNKKAANKRAAEVWKEMQGDEINGKNGC